MYNKKLVFTSSFISILFFGVAITTLGSLATQLQHAFQLDNKGMGTLFSILPIGILVGALIFGPIGDRYGYKLILAAACFGMAVGFIGIAYSTELWLLDVCVFLFGVGGGIINGATSALVADISNENKGANLSILGVFFAIGALGMPFLLGSLEHLLSYQSILSIISVLTALTGIFFLLIIMPKGKQQSGISKAEVGRLFSNRFLWLVAAFLFFESAFEGVLNNWTPTYLREYLNVNEAQSLYALSFGVGGMTVVRFLYGSVLKQATDRTIWTITFTAMFLSILLLLLSNSYWLSTLGFVFMGASLAAGFPYMLGYVGQVFKSLSGTAFSIVFSIALIGNSIINYLIGTVSNNFGVRYIVYFATGMFAVMLLLCIIIIRAKNTDIDLKSEKDI